MVSEKSAEDKSFSSGGGLWQSVGMEQADRIVAENWALRGEPFRLAAVRIDSAAWERGLPAESVERLARCTDGLARARAGASEWLKRRWLAAELGLEAVALEEGEHGKPVLRGGAAEWGFNVSHAGDWAVAVLARGAAAGVDVERLDRKVDVERMGARVFSESERALAAAGGREVFFELWSRKEALLKALGCGWTDGGLRRETRLEVAEFQREPRTGARIWGRRVADGRHVLAVALAEL